MLPPRTILHPTDLSEHSRYAFEVARSLAGGSAARLVLLHVSPNVAVPAREALREPEPGKEYYDRLRGELRRLQEAAAAVPSECRVAEGHPATEILRTAREVGADLIVMGTHGRTGLRRLLMGSVAEQVVRQAPCPVLTVSISPHPTETGAPNGAPDQGREA